MNQLKQKLLLNFIFNQTILHKCQLKEKEAFGKAKAMYNGQIKSIKKNIYKQQEEEEALVKKLNNLKEFYAK